MMRIVTLLAFLSSVPLVHGCAHDQAPSLRMLETKADYLATEPEAQTLALGTAAADGDGGNVPVRLAPKVAHIWLHAHETPEHEYFWGGWLSVVVAGEEWGMQYQPAAAVKKSGQSLKKAKK